MIEGATSRAGTRARIVTVAARLLRDGGPTAVTTRGMAEAAGVQAPAIYRLFGDKDGLLEAVAEHVMADFVAATAADVQAAESGDVDALSALRQSWDRQIDFGVDNPTLFRLLSDPDRVRTSSAARARRGVLAARIRRLAATGQMRVSEQRAVDLIQAAGIGTIQTLLATPKAHRDPALADAMYKAMLTQILTNPDPTNDRPDLSAMVAFRAIASQNDALTPAERQLRLEWLDRAITACGS